ncbi:MAG: hypothetical protein GQ569_03065 [Methylococcaceae bacterium]|nr:hypothetical protein [Methylococcaceae bacterium]
MIEIEVILGVVLTVLFVVLFVARNMMAKGKAEHALEQEAISAAASRLKAAEAEQQEEPQTVTYVVEDVAVDSKPQETVKAEKAHEHHKNLPEDSMLRRHYLTHLRTMDEALHDSRPTDSTLKRHYDTMIEKEVEQCLDDDTALEKLEGSYQEEKQHPLKGKVKKQLFAEVKKAQEATNIPEDSMLRRHYITHVRAMDEALHGDRPTDSALKRHYDTMIEKEVEQCLCDHAALENLECSYNAQKQHTTRGIVKKQIHAAVEKISKIPEDSMLKRHYLTHIRSIIEAEHDSPQPTDSTLKRHYETMIDKEVEAYLETEIS